MTEDLARYREWIGRKRVDEDVVTPFPPRALAATFDTPDDAPGASDPLPPAWHWLFFLDTTRASKLSTDGLPGRGDFLPPVPLPRRMWAGNRLTFHEAPLRIGDPMRRETEIAAVEPKSGSSGTMVFITTRARIHGPAGLAIEEEYDMVLREAARPGETQRVPDRAPAKADISRTVDPDPVLLFRFSALTFNPHRIHYDQPYATTAEGYPALVVHGPLMGLLQVELARRARPDRRMRSFALRARSPVFAGRPFDVQGRHEADGSLSTWIRDPDGGQAQTGVATYF